MSDATGQRGGPVGPGVVSAVLGFVHRMRRAGVPVSMVEALDATATLEHIDATDRRQFRAALRATMVKRAEHEAAFESLFDVFFAVTGDRPAGPVEESVVTPSAEGAQGAGSSAPPDGPASDDLLAMLLDALRSDDEGAMRALAALAVEQHAGITAERTSTERYYLYRVIRQLDLSRLMRRAMAELDPEGMTHLDRRLARDEQERRMEELRRLLAEEIRRRLSRLKGAQEASEAVQDRPLEDVDFLRASPLELREMRQAIQPLARKLAARVARRRRS